MTPQELKNSILQLAIQGKLVPQRAEEGSAEELYKQIQAEKKKLIKEKKIKKEKPFPEITDDEKPFDIPETWKWVRLGEILSVIGGISYKKNDVTKNGIRILRGGNIQDSKIKKFDDDVFLPQTYYEDDKNVKIGDILIVASTGSKTVIGKAGYVNCQMQNTMIGAFLRICRPYFNYLSNYLRYLFESSYYRKHIRDKSQGTNINNIKESYITELLFPLPPLAEQKRIVAKIEELLPYVEQYEKAYNELQELDKRFPGDLQKSILQLAIQGRLVPQRVEEGNAEELYEQIQAEKKKLIKEKKIKKEKPLPEITDEEKPFEIPETWKWVRLGEVVSNLGDGIHGTPEFDLNGNYFFINGNNLDNGNIVIKSDTKRISHTEYEKHKKPLNNNTILISINGTIGNYAFYNNEPIILGKSACYISLLKLIYKYYILYLFKTKFFYDYAVKEATQTTIKNVSLKAMRMLPIPLPPLAEQKRIVAKIEELLPLCEKLKN